MSRYITALLLSAVIAANAQRRVDPKNLYHRIICVTPLTGSGTAGDPLRPKYAPWPLTAPANVPTNQPMTPAVANQTGIIAFSFVPSDDGRLAIVEFVARARAAFDPIFKDASIPVFEKGRVTNAVIETALRKYRKDFSLEQFGMVTP